VRISDRIFGPFFILLGLTVLLYGYSLPPMPGQTYGAGLFPMAIGALLCLGGVVLGIGGWQRRREEAPIALAEWARNRSDLVNLAITFSCILAFALFIQQIGFAVLTAVTATALLMRFGQPWWRAAIAAVIAAAAFQYLFANLMRVPLPAGLLQGIIY
jgi:putative tricarboxylic transport membrane protein